MSISSVFDPGPPPAVAQHLAALPTYAPHRSSFWYDWGPVFYRGRLDGTAKLLGIASDPGPTEQVVCRTLVGDSGQKVQGFLTKLGLTKSYVLVNAFAYALHPSAGAGITPMLSEPQHKQWRNQLLDMITDGTLQAIVAFGGQAHDAVDLWTTKPAGVPVLKVPHPASKSASQIATQYKAAITQLRGIVTPDAGGDNTGPNYGTGVKEADYSPIPRLDLPFGYADWVGDDAWGRHASPRHNNAAKRSGDHAINWLAPTGQA